MSKSLFTIYQREIHAEVVVNETI